MTTPEPAFGRHARSDIARLLPAVTEAAHRAGEAILRVYASDFAVAAKADDSPVTEADHVAEALIVRALSALTPALPIVAEEAVSAGRVPAPAERFWLVDPLDGTREFVERNGEFTVNIALIERGEPVMGVVHVPVHQQTFCGVVGSGATQSDAQGTRAIACRHVPPQGLTVLASRVHGDAQALQAFLAGRRVATLRHAGSSLKLCLLAAGQADLYPRFGRTMEWDIAAGHAVLRAAGGRVTDLNGVELRYGKSGFENPSFIAWGLGDESLGSAC